MVLISSTHLHVPKAHMCVTQLTCRRADEIDRAATPRMRTELDRILDLATLDLALTHVNPERISISTSLPCIVLRGPCVDSTPYPDLAILDLVLPGLRAMTDALPPTAMVLNGQNITFVSEGM